MIKGIVAVLAVLVSAGIAHAEKRVALVIGNSSYRLVSPLANPKNDATLFAATLEKVGFDVTMAVDVDYTGMRSAVRTFGRKLRAAGKDAVGLLYYAGHGVQARGTNYLIPIGADIQTDADLELGALSAAQVLAQMEAAGNRLNLVILDACRNNPFRGRVRSGGRGLARIQAASGTLVAFAAAPGQVANDGTGANSPYTEALVEAISQPGLSVEQVFKKVRNAVEASTGGAQTPWEESSLRGEFYFSGAAPAQAPAAGGIVETRADREALFWSSVKDSGNPELLQIYVDRYPDGTFAGLARVMISQLTAAAERKRRSGKVASLTPATVDSKGVQVSPAEMVVRGLKYENGDGLDRDPAQAAEWYRRAVEKGSAEGKYRLGLLHYWGEGVEQSHEQAAKLILGAVDSGHQPALEALTTVEGLDDPQFLRAVQRRLKEAGYYRSSIDGRWGPGSRRAVAAYARGEPPEPDEPVVRRPQRQERVKPRRQVRVPRREVVREPRRKRRPVHCGIGLPGANERFWNNCQ